MPVTLSPLTSYAVPSRFFAYTLPTFLSSIGTDNMARPNLESPPRKTLFTHRSSPIISRPLVTFRISQVPHGITVSHRWSSFRFTLFPKSFFSTTQLPFSHTAGKSPRPAISSHSILMKPVFSTPLGGVPVLNPNPHERLIPHCASCSLVLAFLRAPRGLVFKACLFVLSPRFALVVLTVQSAPKGLPFRPPPSYQ